MFCLLLVVHGVYYNVLSHHPMEKIKIKIEFKTEINSLLYKIELISLLQLLSDLLLIFPLTDTSSSPI